MEYKIIDVKRGSEWSNSFGTFQSYTLVLENYGEPVGLNKKVPVSQEPQVGDILFGNVELKRNKAGNEYASFKAEKRPEGQVIPTTSSWSEDPNKQDSIHRSVALNDAALIFQGTGEPSSIILSMADDFYMWLKGDDKVDLNDTQALVDKVFPRDEEDHNE